MRLRVPAGGAAAHWVRHGAGLSTACGTGLGAVGAPSTATATDPESVDASTDSGTDSSSGSCTDSGSGDFDWGDQRFVTYRCTVVYDGTAYSGFQLQAGRTDAPTVQWKLERAIRDLTRQPREVGLGFGVQGLRHTP